MAKAIFLIFALSVSLGVQAHHSRAHIDVDHPITLSGTISKKTWRNPHVFYEMSTVNSQGQTETWVLESHSVSSLIRRGWLENSLNVGDRVTAAIIRPHRDASKRYGQLSDVTLANGTRVLESVRPERRETETEVTPSTDFSGTWTLINSVNRDGAIGNEALSGPSHYPLTARGKAQVAAFDTQQDPTFNCIFYGVPRLATSTYSRRWTRERDRIVIEQEQYDVERTIYLDGRSKPDNFKPNIYGFSSGHFEPDGTLVVETTGFSYTPWGNEAGLDSSEQKKVIERYKLSEDGLTMDFSYTITDPVFLTAPVTEHRPYRKVPRREHIYEECDPNNASRHLDA